MKETYDDIISIERFKNFDHTVFKDGEYFVFIKALMSEPVKIKLDEQKDNKKDKFTINWKGALIRSFLHPQLQGI